MPEPSLPEYTPLTGPAMTKFRNRIVGHGMIEVRTVVENPANWRTHPFEQYDALLGVLRDIGYADSIVINLQTGHLCDGHLRVALANREGETFLPVEYLDLAPDEELEYLATHDPLTGMAQPDKERLDALLRDVTSSEGSVQTLLSNLHASVFGITFDAAPNVDEEQATPDDTTVVKLICRNANALPELNAALRLMLAGHDDWSVTVA